jgi:hypothetical protein
MELLLFGFVLFVVIWALVKVFNKESSTRTHLPPRHHTTSSAPSKRDSNLYRPSASLQTPTRSAIKFRDINSSALTPGDRDIKDLVDALTGAPLSLAMGLYQCQRCKVFYQSQSYEVIKSENGGQCVSCKHKEIINVAGRREQRGQNATVSAITLDNYRQYVGQIITFEGNAYSVLTSRRGTDYAVMFENRSWIHGFKMVVFRGCVDKLGGPIYLNNLKGHQLRIRGLLVHHEKYGYQIIVSDRAMILTVR